jgi:hypothetical protein
VSLFLLFVFSFSIVELFPWCGILCLSFNNYSYFTPISFVWSSCFIYLICIYLRILVSNTISISDDVRAVPHVEQKLLTLPEHLILPPGLSGIHVARSLISYAMFCRS